MKEMKRSIIRRQNEFLPIVLLAMGIREKQNLLLMPGCAASMCYTVASRERRLKHKNAERFA